MSQTVLIDREVLARERVMEFLAEAVETLDANALDDLLKRFDKTDFGEVIAHLGPDRPTAKSIDVLDPKNRANYPPKVALKTNGRILIISTNMIDWIQAERDYVRVHVQKESYLVRATMAKIQSKLSDHKFVRIHRSSIVNIDYVVELNPLLGGDYSVKLRSGVGVKMSRAYRDTLPALIPLLVLQ